MQPARGRAAAGGVALMCVALACLALGGLAERRFKAGALDRAQSRWQANAPARYRLVVDEQTASSACRQDLQVELERIVAVPLNECGRVPSWTVSSLFRWAAGHSHDQSRCYPSDVTCVCYSVYRATARYDPQLGFPVQLSYRWHLETNWAYPGHWERMLRAHELPDCAAVSRRVSDFVTITVRSLTRLP